MGAGRRQQQEWGGDTMCWLPALGHVDFFPWLPALGHPRRQPGERDQEAWKVGRKQQQGGGV
eukprot:6714864-Prorocentrum_lima.AAC.1